MEFQCSSLQWIENVFDKSGQYGTIQRLSTMTSFPFLSTQLICRCLNLLLEDNADTMDSHQFHWLSQLPTDEKTLCEISVLHGRWVWVVDSARAMDHVLCLNGMQLRISFLPGISAKMIIWSYMIPIWSGRILSTIQSRIYARGKPRFCYSTEYIQKQSTPKTFYLTTWSMCTLIFCLNTRTGIDRWIFVLLATDS